MHTYLTKPTLICINYTIFMYFALYVYLQYSYTVSCINLNVVICDNTGASKYKRNNIAA